MDNLTKAKISRLAELVEEFLSYNIKKNTGNFVELEKKIKEVIKKIDIENVKYYFIEQLKNNNYTEKHPEMISRLMCLEKLNLLFSLYPYLKLQDLEEIYNKTHCLILCTEVEKNSICSPTSGCSYWVDFYGNISFFVLLKDVSKKENVDFFLDDVCCKAMEYYVLCNTSFFPIKKEEFKKPKTILEKNFKIIAEFFPEYIIHKKKNHILFNNVLKEHFSKVSYENALELEGLFKNLFKKKIQIIKIEKELKELF